MNERKMRRVILAEPYGNQVTRYRYTLECGHELDWVATPRKGPPARKRCYECERIDEFRRNHPKAWDTLVRKLDAVPMDDRATALTHWINHLYSAESMACKMSKMAEDIPLCFELTRPDYRYQLNFDDDEDEVTSY